MDQIHPLQAFRENQNPPLNRRQLADLLGVSTAAVSRWEAGERKLDEQILPMVAEKTGIAPALLRPDLARLFDQPAEAAG